MLTIEKIKELAETMKINQISPYIVETQEEADKMTRESPTGCEWFIGDEYYRIENSKLAGVDKC